MCLCAAELTLDPDWTPPGPRHDFGTGVYCLHCGRSWCDAVLRAACTGGTVGIACADCGAPVWFPVTAPDLAVYQWKGTLCGPCWEAVA